MIISYTKGAEKAWFGVLVEAVAIEKVVLYGFGLDLFRNLLSRHILLSFFL
jgi:hypothetical protein